MSLKKLILSATAAGMLTTAAFAASGPVSLEADGTGDYLVFPSYYALSSSQWKTNLKVVNTNTTSAVVAKVVIREAATSKEDLDFLIYLTPGDVWEGVIYNDGVVKISSTDDSVFKGDTMVSAANPMDQILFDNGPAGNKYGYVEVYGVAQIPAASVPTVAGDTAWGGVGTPLGKNSLYAAYNAMVAAGAPGLWTGVDNNSIYGQEVIYSDFASGEKSMAMIATAFGGVTGPVANTRTIKAVTTTLANSITGQSATATLDQVEEILAKDNVYVTYYNSDSANTVLQLLSPMKKYHFDDLGRNAAAGTNNPYYVWSASQDTSPAAYADNTKGYEYVVTARDQMEHSVKSDNDFSGGLTPHSYCYDELCYIKAGADTSGFETGYLDYAFLPPVVGAGEPVIPTVITGVKVNAAAITNIIYPAYKDRVSTTDLSHH